MESSTPFVNINDDLRRRTLLRSTPALSPLRKSLDVSLNSSALDISNDDEERAKRRQQVELQKRLSNISQDRNTSYNDSFIQEQYVLCTHLYTENKITTKNAWKLQIINMLKPLCEKSGKDTLQVAGTSMDICAKVYGLRVDDVHADGLKLATSLARAAASNPKDGRDNEDGEDDGSDKEGAKDKRKGKARKNRRVNLKGSKNTVSQTPENLCGPVPKLEPTDFTNRVKAETSTIENLLTNIMRKAGTGCSFVLFNTGEKLFLENDPLLKNLHEDKGIDLENLPKINPATLQINIPFNKFRIEKDYDPNQEDPHLESEKSQTLQNLPVDAEGFPIYELDGSVHENFDNDMDMGHENDDIIEAMDMEIAPQARGELERIVDFAPKNATTDISEYSYNSIVNTRTGKYIDQIWAGPSHWKLKFIRRSNARFSGKALAQKVAIGRKKAEPDMINFDEVVETNLPKVVMKRKAQSVDINKITLPLFSLTLGKRLANLGELMLRPNVYPVEKKKEKAPELEYEFSNYNYDNPNDSNYCSQNNAGDADHDTDDVFGDNIEDNIEDVRASQEGYNDNLVDAPEMVPTNYMSYALKAKQMDMKKLKASVWQHLTNPVKKEVEKENKVYPTPFSKMYEALPSYLTKKEKDELSCPLAFVALLHLCNEQNLKLIQLPNYKDFEIHSHP